MKLYYSIIRTEYAPGNGHNLMIRLSTTAIVKLSPSNPCFVTNGRLELTDATEQALRHAYADFKYPTLLTGDRREVPFIHLLLIWDSRYGMADFAGAASDNGILKLLADGVKKELLKPMAPHILVNG